MRRPAAARAVLALIPGLTLVAAGCGVLDSLTEPSSLTIKEFSASPALIVAGSDSVVTWDVAGADRVEIDNGVGPVSDRGSIRVRPQSTTTYTLTAFSGSSQMAAVVQVMVEGGTQPTPTPTPTPEPTPTPQPTATPAPTPTPGATSCGTPSGAPQGCSLLVVRNGPLPQGQCVELNEVAVDNLCPVNDGTRRVLSFTVTASTPHSFLRWRKAQGNADLLLPSEGFVAGNDVSTVLLNDTVKGEALTIELLDPADQQILSFTLRHR